MAVKFNSYNIANVETKAIGNMSRYIKCIFFCGHWATTLSVVNLCQDFVLFRDITDDEACVDELRQTFRFFASVLVRRAQKVSSGFLESIQSKQQRPVLLF